MRILSRCGRKRGWIFVMSKEVFAMKHVIFQRVKQHSSSTLYICSMVDLYSLEFIHKKNTSTFLSVAWLWFVDSFLFGKPLPILVCIIYVSANNSRPWSPWSTCVIQVPLKAASSNFLPTENAVEKIGLDWKMWSCWSEIYRYTCRDFFWMDVSELHLFVPLYRHYDQRWR